MKEKDPSTLIRFQDIVEPFELATSTPIIIIIASMLVVIVLYFLVRRRKRGLLNFISTVERECRTGACSPREAVQQIHKALDDAGVDYHTLKDKFVIYQFSKVMPDVDEVSALVENLKALLVARQ